MPNLVSFYYFTRLDISVITQEEETIFMILYDKCKENKDTMLAKYFKSYSFFEKTFLILFNKN